MGEMQSYIELVWGY